MNYDPTISLGTIISAFMLVITLLGIFARVTMWLQDIKRDFDNKYSEIRQDFEEKHRDNIRRIALIEQRIDDLWSWFKGSTFSRPGDHQRDKG